MFKHKIYISSGTMSETEAVEEVYEKRKYAYFKRDNYGKPILEVFHLGNNRDQKPFATFTHISSPKDIEALCEFAKLALVHFIQEE